MMTAKHFWYAQIIVATEDYKLHELQNEDYIDSGMITRSRYKNSEDQVISTGCRAPGDLM